MTRAHRFLFLTIVLALTVKVTVAQVQTGTPPFGSFGGGPDVINLGNLNAHLTIPVLHKPGRGTNFTYDLAYDSSVWYPVTSGSTTSWQPVANWGWGIVSQPVAGLVTYRVTPRTCTDRISYYGNYNLYSNWTFIDSFGTAHPTSITVSDESVVAPDCTSPIPGPYSSGPIALTDGSGYMLSVTADPAATLTTASGTTLYPNVNYSSTGTATDRNGNQISVSTGVFTDTLGTTALTVAGVAPSNTTFTYTAPSTANASYAMIYTTYSIQTNFGCGGTVTDYGTNGNMTANLVSEIHLPDWNATTNPNSKYTFTYEPTYGHSGFVTGRLASVTLPTGGTISYQYSTGGTGVNGISCSDGSATTVVRTTPDGTWTYARTQVSGNHWQITITDPTTPTANQTVIDFQKDSSTNPTQNFYETQRQVYQGSVAPANLLKTINICYNGNLSNCATTAVAAPITQRNVTDILPGTSNLRCQHIYKYNSSGSLIEQDDYDYGSGANGPLLKKTAITFASLGSITKFRQTVTVTNGSGSTVSQTNYNYDETSVVATSGTPQHTTVTGSRGNLTSVNYYPTSLTKRMTYFDTGNVQSVTDVNGGQTTYNYLDATSTCGNAFPTSITEAITGLSKSMTWNCTGGIQHTSVDENNQTTTSSFSDAYFWRSASITDPSSAAINLTYTGQTLAEGSVSFNGGNSSSDAFITLDGLGRKHLSQIRETPGGSNFDTTETDYDASGRVSRVTLPYVGTAGQTNSSAPAQTTTYDALNRTLSLSDNSGGSRTFSYSQNDVFITRGPAPTGENTKRRQEEFDALGRLTSVCEITAGTTSAPAGTCAQTSSQTGYWTKYSYDALGRLTGVTQNAQSSNQQTRTYVYDLLGRLASETNPETGTTTYTYDTDISCGTSNGDRVKKTDAVGNVTCTAYDTLHRPTAITYPSGSYASVTPAKHFVYDAATVNGVAMTSVKGRLAEAYTCTGACSSKITDEGFSYTVRGEPSDIYESTPHSGGYYHVNQTYWANSGPYQLTAPGIPTITYSPDGEGRPYKVSSSSGQNPVTNTVFNAASLPTSVTYGSADSDAFTYDSNTNRITQYQFTVNGQSLIGALTWNANHTLSSQNITDPFFTSDTQNCSYSHDDLTRLASVNCGSIWSQTFSYDAFGNISKSGTYSFQPVYKDTNGNTTNRFVSIPGTTVSYDANGNVLADGSHTYSMDSAGKPVTVDSVNLTYDAFGRMAEQNRSGAYTQIVYSPGRAKLALMNGQTLQKGLLPLPGGGVAVYNSSGLLYYGHSDHLGSIKVGSTPSRTIYFDLAYAPFGETYATYGTTDPAFTGQRQDTVAGLFDFPAREYSTQGRWPDPDPSGLASVHLSDPQTLNRYAYVRNNPLVMIDPQGLVGCSEVDGGEFENDGCFAGVGGTSGPGPNLGPDPNPGDPGNSSSDCTAGATTCGGNTSCPPDSCFTVPGNDPNYMVEVSASLSDGTQPVIETQSAQIDTTLQEECSCLLGQMQNDSQSMATVSGANTLVEIAGYIELAGAGAVLTPGAAVFVVDNWLKITAITAATTFAVAETAGVAGLETTGPPQTGHTENDPHGGETREDPAPISGPPVAGEPPPPPAF